MRRCTFLLLTVLGVCASARATITITPSEPTPSDEVWVTVSYWMPTGGYSIDHVVRRNVGGVFRLDLYWNTPAPDAVVTQACVLHEHTECLGKLFPGGYMVQVIHHGINNLGESQSFRVWLFDSTLGSGSGISLRWPASFSLLGGYTTGLPINTSGNDTLNNLILRLLQP
jgi:hypothetical protein